MKNYALVVNAQIVKDVYQFWLPKLKQKQQILTDTKNHKLPSDSRNTDTYVQKPSLNVTH